MAKKKVEEVKAETAEVKEETLKEEKPKRAKKAKKVEEPKVEEKPKATEAICIAKGVRVTPRKMRLVIDVVRGLDVNEALGLLKAINKAGAEPAYKAIKSASANATNNFGLDGDKLYIAEIQASDGIRMKRYIPRAKGSASSITKRTSNLRVVVKERR